MKAELYTEVAAMEPLLPESSGPNLTDLTCEILRKAGELSAHLPSSVIRQRVAGLVREMNSYYSNLIEGHKTLPRDIERAMRQEYSSNPTDRANQLLSRAHIEVETLMGERLAKEEGLSIHSQEFFCWIHREFYTRLPEELHFSKDRSGKKYRIEPGTLRTFEVDVDRTNLRNGVHCQKCSRDLRVSIKATEYYRPTSLSRSPPRIIVLPGFIHLATVTGALRGYTPTPGLSGAKPMAPAYGRFHGVWRVGAPPISNA